MKIKIFEKSKKIKKSVLTVATFFAITSAGCNISAMESKEVYIPNPAIATSVNVDSSVEENEVSNELEMTESLDESLVEPQVDKTLWSLEEINAELKEYGSITMAGMPAIEYDEAMAIPWVKLENIGEPETLSIDLMKVMNYETIKKYINNLDKYEGIDVYSIGKSAQDRDIFMINVAIPKPDEPLEQIENRPLIILSGNTHAREGAGCEFLIKILNDTIVQCQKDPYIKTLLQNIRFSIVPLVNPDGREMILNGGHHRRKANSRGVDLNRNFPSLNAGQLYKGIPRDLQYYSAVPAIEFYPGPYCGSEPETKAIMKWLETYVPKAKCLIDLHQQGDVFYFDKNFLSVYSQNRSKALGDSTNVLIGGTYDAEPVEYDYGVDGMGGTLTDYARSLAEGMLFSYKYGRQVMIIDGVERPLITFRDVDKVIEHFKPVNPEYSDITIEIGPGSSYLGYGPTATKLKNNIYIKHNYKQFIQKLTEKALGKEKVQSIKDSLQNINKSSLKNELEDVDIKNGISLIKK